MIGGNSLNDVSPQEIGAAVRQVLGDTLGYLYPAALRVAIRLDVADQLAKGPMTAEALAAISGVSPDHLRRVLRFLATRGVFREDDSGAFHLTTAAGLLRSDSPASVRTTALLLTDEIYWLSAGRLEDTVRTGQTVFDEIFGAPLFDYLAKNEECGRLFHTGIADLSTMEQDGIADSYQFPEHGTMVDVGGGPGGFLHAVLIRNPGLTGVLFDQQTVLREHRLGDPAIADRWRTIAGDFFTEVPAGGDVYTLKRVLHDWDDAHCLKILTACRRAMTEHARLLVIDAVVPPGNDPHPSKLYDIAMMATFQGKERTKAEFVDLLTAAGFTLRSVSQTPGTLSVLEALPA
jgi:O-methyltransferase domain